MSETYISCTDYIKLEDCKEGYVYRILSRNLAFGVFQKDGFIGIREKFKSRYLFKEYHWDTGAPYGTVKPKEEIQYCSLIINEDSKELFEFLDSIEKQSNWTAFGYRNEK